MRCNEVNHFDGLLRLNIRVEEMFELSDLLGLLRLRKTLLIIRAWCFIGNHIFNDL